MSNSEREQRGQDRLHHDEHGRPSTFTEDDDCALYAQYAQLGTRYSRDVSMAVDAALNVGRPMSSRSQHPLISSAKAEGVPLGSVGRIFSRPTATAACRSGRSAKGTSCVKSSKSTPPKEKTSADLE